METHHKRPGGRALELILLFALMALTLVLPFGMVLLTKWLGYGTAHVAFGAGIALSVPLWRAFLRYYKYELHTLKPITEKDDHK
ncbi:MAG: hypothetical protein ACRC6I_11340 [Paracoccaceae bacterium]